MASLQERFGTTLFLQQLVPNQLEDELLRVDVLRMWAAASATSHPGSSSVNGVALASKRVAFHKPAAGVNQQQAAGYGHDPLSVLINESAAWMIARELGSPFDDWVPTTVVRSLWPQDTALIGGFGALSEAMPGYTNIPDPLHDAAICDPAALWDALIGQQDRHYGNYRFDRNAPNPRLGLIDSGYAFASPRPANKYFPHASVFVQERITRGRRSLAAGEIQMLDNFLANEALLLDVGSILPPEQYAALIARATRMVATSEILGVLEF